MRASERIVVIFYMTVFVLAASFCSGLKIFGGTENDLTATAGRNLRADARYYFTKANEAMDNMFRAEEDDDVDSYVKHLEDMRSYDKKLIDASTRYEQLRDFLEAKIWQGQLVIEGFDLLYEKTNWNSILDHLTFRVKH